MPGRRYVGPVWFVDMRARWYVCVLERPSPGRVVVRAPATGLDDLREAPWPYPGDLEFKTSSPLYQRVRAITTRPLK